MAPAFSVHRLNKFANFFLIHQDQELSLIDTGIKDSIQNLRKKFERLGFDLSQLKRIIITHSHYDHAGSASALKNSTGARVMAHEQEAPFLEHKARIPRPPGLGGFLFYATEPLFRAPAVEVDVPLQDGASVEGTGLTVVHTPGHTPGSIALYHAGSRSLFTGDTINNWRGRLGGPVTYFSSDIEKARQSVSKLLELDIHTLYFAHGDTMEGVSREHMETLLA